ncbi:MAG: manganese efflux pump MntP family protein [Tannerella sp.]|jgi:putative Mn2+ efflux pump MntP|nr:manganese efflux pump MntP family protein [Tannerella sp.]
MSFIEIVLLAVGLSMDSLAVSLAGGAVISDYRPYCLVKIASVMALFQAGMTFIGSLAGSSFYQYICEYDHWVAFALLLYLGCRMIYEGCRHNKDDCQKKAFNPMNNRTLLSMALATSIDALAVGISFAMLRTSPVETGVSNSIATPVITIFAVTFLFSAIGVYCGHRFGCKTRINMNILGGLILIGIGSKILIEHFLET